MKNTAGYLAVIATTGLTLTACVGGGGGSAGGSTAFAIDAADIQAADPEKVKDSAANAASSLPRFGSVTQSTNRNVAGVTTDAAEATFDGDNLTVRIAREDESRLTFGTAGAVEDTGVLADEFFRIPGVPRSYRSWGIVSASNDRVTLSRVAATWADGDTTDWAAGGYWLHLTGDLQSRTVTGAEVGAFVDGPELDLTDPPDMPIQGTARYEGTVAGAYAATWGTDLPSPGSVEVGEFTSTIELTADFSAQNIRAVSTAITPARS